MLFGTDPRLDAHIGVRRGRSEADGKDTYFAANGINGNNINHLAWLEDVQYANDDGTDITKVNFGEWTSIPNTLISVYRGHNDAIKQKAVDPSLLTKTTMTVDDEYRIDLSYTKINKTITFDLEIFFESGAFESLDTINQPLAIFIEPDLTQFKQTFQPAEKNSTFTSPIFTDSKRYRDLTDDGFTSHRMYTCQVYYKSATVYFLITTSAITGTDYANVFSTEDLQTEIRFGGTYQTEDRTPFVRPTLTAVTFDGGL